MTKRQANEPTQSQIEQTVNKALQDITELYGSLVTTRNNLCREVSMRPQTIPSSITEDIGSSLQNLMDSSVSLIRQLKHYLGITAPEPCICLQQLLSSGSPGE